jgi:hypothetical protein
VHLLWAGGVAQVVEHMPSKQETLSSFPPTPGPGQNAPTISEGLLCTVAELKRMRGQLTTLTDGHTQTFIKEQIVPYFRQKSNPHRRKYHQAVEG